MPGTNINPTTKAKFSLCKTNFILLLSELGIIYSTISLSLKNALLHVESGVFDNGLHAGLLWMAACFPIIGLAAFKEEVAKKKFNSDAQRQAKVIVENGMNLDPRNDMPDTSQDKTHISFQDSDIEQLTKEISEKEKLAAKTIYYRIECSDTAARVADMLESLVENGSTGIRMPHVIALHMENDISKYEGLADEYGTGVETKYVEAVMRAKQLLGDRREIINKNLRSSTNVLRHLEADAN